MGHEVCDTLEHGTRLQNKGGQSDSVEVHALAQLGDDSKEDALWLIVQHFLFQLWVVRDLVGGGHY